MYIYLNLSSLEDVTELLLIAARANFTSLMPKPVLMRCTPCRLYLYLAYVPVSILTRQKREDNYNMCWYSLHSSSIPLFCYNKLLIAERWLKPTEKHQPWHLVEKPLQENFSGKTFWKTITTDKKMSDAHPPTRKSGNIFHKKRNEKAKGLLAQILGKNLH